MAIVYAVVARGTTVLAEFSAVTGNTGAVARRILEKLPDETESRLCFSQDRYIFHILRSDGIIFLCMANETFGRRIPFSYLEDIHMRFMKNYGKVASYAPAYSMNDEFSRVLHQQMEFFSSNPSADTLNRVRGEVGEASQNLFVFVHSYCNKMDFTEAENGPTIKSWVEISFTDFSRYAQSWLIILRKYLKEGIGLSYSLIKQEQCKTMHFTSGNSRSALGELFG